MRIPFVLVFSIFFVAVNCTPANLYFGNGMTVRSQRQHGMVFTGFFAPANNNAHKDGYNFETPLNTEEQVLPNVDTTMKFNEEDSQMPQDTATENTDTSIQNETPDQEDDEESDEEDDDEDDYTWPFFTSRRKSQQPFFNFFPVSFGGYGRSSGNSPSSVAIANSFSTGTKGIAASSATAFGETSPSRYGRPKPSKSQQGMRVQSNKPDQNKLTTETPKTDSEDNITATEETILNSYNTTQTTELPMEITTEEMETSTKLEETEKQDQKNESEEEDTVSINEKEESQPTTNFFPITFEGSAEGPVSVANSLSMGSGSIATSDAKASEMISENSRGMVLGRYVQKNDKEERNRFSKEDVINQHTEYGLPSETVNSDIERTTPINEEAPETKTATTETAEISSKVEKTTDDTSEDSVEEDKTFLPKNSDGQQSVNFFPISFEGSGRSAGNSIGNVAIANSYSTGKKGVATSNANAFANKANYRQEGMTVKGHYGEQTSEKEQQRYNNEASINSQSEFTNETQSDSSTFINQLPQGATTENTETSTIVADFVDQKTNKNEESDEEDNIFMTKNGYQPSYNYFPITFSNFGRSTGNPGTVAIANSFSTGKNGVAMSNAKTFAKYSQEKMIMEHNDQQNNEEEQQIFNHEAPFNEETGYGIPSKNVSPNIDATTEVPKEITTETIEITTKIQDITDQKTKKQIDDNEESKNVAKKDQQPSYNYFPITFSGSGRSAGNPGTIAIANSFSAGQKGVAVSDAKAFANKSRYTQGMIFIKHSDQQNKKQEQQLFNHETSINPQTEYGIPNENVDGTTNINDLPQELTTENTEASMKIEEITNKTTKKQKDDSEEEDENENDFITSKKTQQPSYNYFPISFGGSGRSLGRVAIANSFSTGKNGMAISKAEAGGYSNELEKARYQQETTTILPEEQNTISDQDVTTEISDENEETTQNNEITTEDAELSMSTTESVETTTVLDATTKEAKNIVPKTKSSTDGNLFSSRRGQQPFFNYFPIAFGGYGRTAEMPFGTVTIANSFSTGRGGVASSSATSFGEAVSARKRGNARYVRYY